MTQVHAVGLPPCRKPTLTEFAWLARLLAVTLIGVLLLVDLARAEGQAASLGAALPGHAAVVDQAQLLSEAERRELTERLTEVEATRGVRMGVVLLGSTGEDSIEDYANQLGNAWHIGDAGGVLIVVAVQDRHARIEVSRAVEDRLPDVVAGRILRESMMPAFKAQRYRDGLLDSVRRVDQALLETPADPAASVPDAGQLAPAVVAAHGHLAGWVAITLMLLWLIVLVYCLILFVRDRLTMRAAAGVAGGKALIEAGLFSTVMSVPSSVIVALISGVGVWLILLLASGVRRLFGGGARRDPEAGQTRRKPSKPARRPSEKRQRGRKAGLVANERRRQTEDCRSFWSSSGSSSDSSCSSDSSGSSSSNDFGGGGASSSW